MPSETINIKLISHYGNPSWVRWYVESEDLGITTGLEDDAFDALDVFVSTLRDRYNALSKITEEDLKLKDLYKSLISS